MLTAFKEKAWQFVLFYNDQLTGLKKQRLEANTSEKTLRAILARRQ